MVAFNKLENGSMSRFSSYTTLWGLLVLGFVMRIILAPVWFGYESDVNTFMAWSARVASVGLSGMYQNTESYFIDYPPGYMYVLYLIGKFHGIFEILWSSKLSIIAIKTPAMVSDLILAFMVYKIAIGRPNISNGQALGLAALIAFNPVLWLNSTVWGQVDSFFMVFIVAYLLFQQRNQLVIASVLLALAILLKPQALLFLPFFLIAVVLKRDLRLMGYCIISGLATIIIVALPFKAMNPQGFMWLYDLYAGTLSSYSYASLNAFNLMTLFRGNFVEIQQTVFIFTYELWGWIFLFAGLCFVGYLQVKGRELPGKIFYLMFLFMTIVFVLSTKMHERYLFYSLPLVLISYIFIKDRRILSLFIGFCITNILNVSYVLRSSFEQKFHISNQDVLMFLVSIANVVLLGCAIWLGWLMFKSRSYTMNQRMPIRSKLPNSRKNPLKKSNELSLLEKDRAYKLNQTPRLFTKRDLLYVSILVVVYSIIAFSRLGGHEAPETFWKPSAVGEAIIVDLGQSTKISRINSFAGVGQGTYSYWFSEDSMNWDNPMKVESNHAKVLTWHTVEPQYTARFVKIEINQIGLYVHEVAFFQDQEQTPIPLAEISVSHESSMTKQDIAYVFDESDTVPYAPSFMEGTYFDEIYHARTAYEHLHQIEPYENTHPPLGKVIISFGIWLFGLNPFGWRFMGTLFGVAMIPLMYVFAKKLFGNSTYAFIAALLLSFEFMHFAQTRIATIDVYGVFFIMLMFYFMYQFYSLSFYRESLIKTLVPLGLAGLTFGLGIASKWIVFYGGAGLAVILLLVLLERFSEYKQASNQLQLIHITEQKRERNSKKPIEWSESSEEVAYLHRIVHVFHKYTIMTLLWCVLTFVFIPVVIYLLSYIPFMQVSGPGHELKDVFTYQKNMYDYHKNLVATHPFSSSWWAWPLMLRPIWYYQGHFLPEGMLSSIISFGNPLIWWPGVILVLSSFYVAYRTRSRILVILLIGYCSQYLPWILIPRLTFIYHYFAMVPFMILIITYYIKLFLDKYPMRKRIVVSYLSAVALLFVLFYPLLSGFVIPNWYSVWLRWLPGWNFF